MKKRYLVPVNVRYKEYHLVEVEVGDDEEWMGPHEAVGAVLEGKGEEVEGLREFVENMDSSGWDDPEEITEERWNDTLKEGRQLLKDKLVNSI